MPPRAVITNYVSCYGSSLFYQRIEEFHRKKVIFASNQCKQVLKSKKVIFEVSNTTICDKVSKKSKGRKNIRVGAGAGAVLRIYGSTENRKKYYGSESATPSPVLFFFKRRQARQLVYSDSPRHTEIRLDLPPELWT